MADDERPRRIENDPDRDAESPADGDDGDGDGEVAEIDLAVIEAAIDAMAEAGLDLDDVEECHHHLTALVASFLRTAQDDAELDDVEVGEMAADLAAAAVEIALEVDELPPFRESVGD